MTKGDCWIGISQAEESGLILAYKVGKHRDKFIEEIIINTEIKTECKGWFTDGWGGYERVRSQDLFDAIAKENTQQLELTNGIIRQLSSRWRERRKKNKEGFTDRSQVSSNF